MLPTAHRPCMHAFELVIQSSFNSCIQVGLFKPIHADNQADLHRISAVRKHISIASSLI